MASSSPIDQESFLNKFSLSPKLLKWSLTIRCSLISNPWCPLYFGKVILPFCRGFSRYILRRRPDCWEALFNSFSFFLIYTDEPVHKRIISFSVLFLNLFFFLTQVYSVIWCRGESPTASPMSTFYLTLSFARVSCQLFASDFLSQKH